MSTSGSDGLAYFSFDPVGNVSEITNYKGESIKAEYLSPFGSSIALQGLKNNRLSFLGEYGVISDGDYLFELRNRYYDSSIGRFLIEDPSSLVDVNRYAYVKNNPISYVDPVGLEREMASQAGFDRNAFEKTAKRPIWQYLKSINPWFEIGRVWEKFRGVKGRLKEPLEKIVNYNPFEDPIVEEGSWQSIQPIIKEFIKLPIELTPGGEVVTTIGELPEPQTELIDAKGSSIPRARDINALTGPSGYGPQNFIESVDVLPYRINFENESTATAPAQIVTVSNPLAANFGLSTFELTEIGFGDHFIAVPGGTQHYNSVKKMTYNGVSFDVQIEAGIRLTSGEVYAKFTSLDPLTGLPPAVDIGFLPPENGTGRGQGHVSYVVKQKTGLPTGVESRNIAQIVFDGQ